MSKAFFQAIEHSPHGTRFELTEILQQLSFNQDGLIPVIAQDSHSQQVLMQAWMNRQAIEKTLACGNMVYWSRSRQCYWEKGATSGNSQKLVKMAIDCDGDVILCQVQQQGPACHTGRPACFYLQVDAHEQQVQILGDAQAQ